MKGPVDLTKIIKRGHEGKWVALSKDYKKVLGASGNLKTLTKKVGRQDVVYMRVPLSGYSYAFTLYQ